MSHVREMRPTTGGQKFLGSIRAYKTAYKRNMYRVMPIH